MDRYEIQDLVKTLWREAGHTKDTLTKIKAALNAARDPEASIEAVPSQTRQIAWALSGLYDGRPKEAAACYSYLEGWLAGVEKVPHLLDVLNKMEGIEYNSNSWDPDDMGDALDRYEMLVLEAYDLMTKEVSG
jgi:hypothetical protein